MNATVHAVAVLALLPLVLILLGRFGSFPKTWKDWFMATVRGLCGYVFVIILITLVTLPPMCGPAPYTQVMLAANSGGMCVALGRTRTIRFWMCVTFIAAGVLLSQHYFSLLRSTEEYAGMGDDGRPAITCSKPVTAYKLWHTSFTGIYGLKPR